MRTLVLLTLLAGLTAGCVSPGTQAVVAGLKANGDACKTAGLVRDEETQAVDLKELISGLTSVERANALLDCLVGPLPAGKSADEQLQLRLRMIAKALAAFEEGEYGYCRRCDEPIALARLQAKPETPFCVQCQSKAENE